MKTYITVQGDTWDMIAKKVYNDEKKMDVLMQNNFPLLNYVIFPAGVKMCIPENMPKDQESLPIWRR